MKVAGPPPPLEAPDNARSCLMDKERRRKQREGGRKKSPHYTLSEVRLPSPLSANCPTFTLSPSTSSLFPPSLSCVCAVYLLVRIASASFCLSLSPLTAHTHLCFTTYAPPECVCMAWLMREGGLPPTPPPPSLYTCVYRLTHTKVHALYKR